MTDVTADTKLEPTYTRLGRGTKRRLAAAARRKTMPAAVLLRILVDEGLDRIEADERRKREAVA
jgi:hypothetical protein